MVYRYICTHYCPLSHGPGADEAAQITDHAVVCVLTIIYINVEFTYSLCIYAHPPVRTRWHRSLHRSRNHEVVCILTMIYIIQGIHIVYVYEYLYECTRTCTDEAAQITDHEVEIRDVF
jgi:hypothetical protein